MEAEQVAAAENPYHFDDAHADDYHDAPPFALQPRSNSIFMLLFFVFFVLLNLQFLSISGVENDEGAEQASGGSQVRVYHIFSLILALYIVPSIPWLRIPFSAYLYFGCALLSNLLAYRTYGFNGRAVTLGFSAYMFLTGLYVGRFMNRDHLLRIVRGVFLVVQIAVFLKIAYYLVLLGRDIPRKPGGRPDMIMMYAGGNNLEVTWLGLATVFFATQIKYFPLFANCIFASALYQSRIGIMAPVMTLAYRVAAVRTVPTIMWIVAIGCVGAIIVLPLVDLRSLPIVERFSSIGEEGEFGSTTRLMMWEAAYDAIRVNPWGHGVGNSMHYVEHILSQDLKENNVHNMYVQMALDGGIQTLVCYIVLIVNFTIRMTRGGYKDPFGVFVLLYFVIGMIQFTGQEPFAWLFMGIAYTAPDTLAHEEEHFEHHEDEPELDETHTEESRA